MIYETTVQFAHRMASAAVPWLAWALAALLDGVNAIFRQVGLHFSLGNSVTNVINSGWASNGLVSASIGVQIRNIMRGTDGLEIYFIPGNDDGMEPAGIHNSFGIIVKNSADAIVLSHEFGHACGLYDIYCQHTGIMPPDITSGLRMEWMPNDWNNGTGCRFYDPLLTQGDAVRRLLMHGERTNLQSDISSGGVLGVSRDGVIGPINVGRSGMLTLQPRSL